MKPCNLLSKHLFWDTDPESADFEKSKTWIIKRVLGYGLLSDLLFIISYYGIQEIADHAVKIKDLDLRTASLIAVLSDKSEDQFVCYTEKQSNLPHLNFLRS